MKWAPFIFVFVFFSCGPSQDKITVACASNLAPAMDSIALAFEEKEGIEVEVVSGASGTLTTQIEQGAPYDIFISASMEYLFRLKEQDLIGRPQPIITSNIYAVMPVSYINSNLDSILMDPEMTAIAIADPEVAPYGKAAKEYLIQKGIWSGIQEKIVYAEDVAQVISYLESENVDIGFGTPYFLTKPNAQYAYFELDQAFYAPITQSVVKVKSSDKAGSDSFIEFMLTSEASEILQYFGY